MAPELSKRLHASQPRGVAAEYGFGYLSDHEGAVMAPRVHLLFQHRNLSSEIGFQDPEMLERVAAVALEAAAYLRAAQAGAGVPPEARP